MLNADMLKQNYGMKFNTQIELFSNNKAKTIIVDAYKEEKRFRR